MKDFMWFTKNSWSYMQGQRKDFFTGFYKAWKEYHRLTLLDK